MNTENEVTTYTGTKKPNRTRNIPIGFRLNEEENEILNSKVKKSGLTKQSFLINAITGATFTSSDALEVLKGICNNLEDLTMQIRGMATNLNQMAHVANGKGILPTQLELENLARNTSDKRKECEEIWQSLRLLTGQQRRTQQ